MLQKAVDKISRENAQASGSQLIQEARDLEREAHLLQVQVQERDANIEKLLKLKKVSSEATAATKMVGVLKETIRKCHRSRASVTKLLLRSA